MSRDGLRSFSLLELLVVVTVLAILLAIIMEGYAGVVQSTAVTTSAAMLDDALTQARANAVAQNMTVEVRIYDLPPTVGGTPVYNAMQLHWLKPDGTTPAVASPLLLSPWVVIDPTATYSPLIASNPEAAMPDASDSRLNGGTRVFHFLPDGSTDLNQTTNWFMTVRAANQSASANWACLRVDPATGRAQVYRP